MSEFQAKFEAYGGDYAATMPRFLGSEEMYFRIFAMLFRDENMTKLKDSLQAGDLHAAFEAAHTLKGVAGNLGLTPFYNAVCKIVEPLRSGEKRQDYQQLYQEIRTEFQKVEQLRQELSPDDENA